MIIDNRYHRIKSIFGYRLRALVFTQSAASEQGRVHKLQYTVPWMQDFESDKDTYYGDPFAGNLGVCPHILDEDFLWPDISL